MVQFLKFCLVLAVWNVPATLLHPIDEPNLPDSQLAKNLEQEDGEEKKPEIPSFIEQNIVHLNNPDSNQQPVAQPNNNLLSNSGVLNQNLGKQAINQTVVKALQEADKLSAQSAHADSNSKNLANSLLKPIPNVDTNPKPEQKSENDNDGPELQVQRPKLGLGDQGPPAEDQHVGMVPAIGDQLGQVDKPKESLLPGKPVLPENDQAVPVEKVQDLLKEKDPVENEVKGPLVDDKLEQPPLQDLLKNLPVPKDSPNNDELPEPKLKNQLGDNMMPQNPFPFEAPAAADGGSNMRVPNEVQGISLNYVLVIICSLLLLLICAWKPLCHALCAVTSTGLKPFIGGQWSKGYYHTLNSENA